MPQPKERYETVTEALIALGSNATSSVETSIETLTEALVNLESLTHHSIKISKFYRTPAFPPGSGPDFVNAAALVRTSISATCVLQKLHVIEAEFGRTRNERWAPRTLDLDLIALGDTILPDRETLQQWMDLPLQRQMSEAPDDLILPHPRVQERAFVLVPLNDVAPHWRHPVLGLTVAEMTNRLDPAARAEIRPIAAPPGT
ncbi:2-amino-4-hydroxy-6-hydroxymethyldihydropteridine diphosphokinase [Brevirhabdus pacifica]|uniref:2-amino-4-hydroxy-6-hydroxymethyldihydropteridine pyrophosphokinase n=1 Tax=Brevirhabdus pacifica TaxID=1267768 RepID=A0A1U7DJI5_9RHOB|nr:2-amino-4-hydroxy-6-hydroxymethyldihydropteridine diphosphokinase [Brevirhabdus pacifica]PJJ82662.1 2-amino-4-hydroxy-6-hydroxymethyldihydropteridine diphosphokinase [Brevirhabdus pacifica]